MTLYHFTCRLWWHFVRHEGITRGEVPVNRETVLQYPNLTSDPTPSGQGWAGGGLNKQAVRITVQVPDRDGRLVTWRALTLQHGMEREYYRGLDRAGGWGAKNWWIYQGIIPPEWFTDIEFFGEAGVMEAEVLTVAEHYSRFEDFRRDWMTVGTIGNLEVDVDKLISQMPAERLAALAV